MPRPTRFFPGQLYGRLTAVERSERPGYGRFVCTCGTTKEVLIGHVTRGRVQACGCLQKERSRQSLTERQTTHGQYGSKTYAAWHSMRQRPLWQYILIDYPQVGVITVTRTSKRID